MVSDEEGGVALRLARRAIEATLDPANRALASESLSLATPPIFDQPRGVFVTLKKFPGGALRGCIGFPLPVYPLRKALREAAVSAATKDPRFSSVVPTELPHITIEVSILTVPVAVRATPPDSIATEIRVGRDGILLAGYGASGLLLPQVAPEQGWSAEEFLEGACEKAGLPGGAWRDPRVSVRRFEAEVFREASPTGPGERGLRDVTPLERRPAPRT